MTYAWRPIAGEISLIGVDLKICKMRIIWKILERLGQKPSHQYTKSSQTGTRLILGCTLWKVFWTDFHRGTKGSSLIFWKRYTLRVKTRKCEFKDIILKIWSILSFHKKKLGQYCIFHLCRCSFRKLHTKLIRSWSWILPENITVRIISRDFSLTSSSISCKVTWTLV